MAITPDTKFRITVAGMAMMFVSAFGFGWKFQATLSSINTSVSDAVSKINAVEKSLNDRLNDFERTVSDRFTRTAAAEWGLRLQILNPTLKVPDPRNPERLLSGRVIDHYSIAEGWP